VVIQLFAVGLQVEPLKERQNKAVHRLYKHLQNSNSNRKLVPTIAKELIQGNDWRRDTTGDNRKELQDLLHNAQHHSFFRREWLDTSSIEGGGIIEDKTEHRDNTERHQIGIERREQWVTEREGDGHEWYI